MVAVLNLFKVLKSIEDLMEDVDPGSENASTHICIEF